MSQPEKIEDISNMPVQQKPEAEVQETDHGEDVSMETMSSENVDDQWHATTVLAALVKLPFSHQMLISELVSLLHRHIRTLFHDCKCIFVSGSYSWRHDECRVDTPCLYPCHGLYVPQTTTPLTGSFLAHQRESFGYIWSKDLLHHGF
jgi:hypothetical protein